MKKIFLTIVSLVFIAGILTITTGFKTETTQNESSPEGLLTIPDSVNTVLQNKCYDCHNSKSESMKAKMKLNLDKLPTVSKRKLVSKLDAIAESVEEKDMPPKKFLKKYPEHALTDDESKILIDWANNAADELMK
jgi:uncharacterized membrane protein